MRQASITRKPTRTTNRADQDELAHRATAETTLAVILKGTVRPEKAGASQTARRPGVRHSAAQPEISPLALDVAAA